LATARSLCVEARSTPNIVRSPQILRQARRNFRSVQRPRAGSGRTGQSAHDAEDVPPTGATDAGHPTRTAGMGAAFFRAGREVRHLFNRSDRDRRTLRSTIAAPAKSTPTSTTASPRRSSEPRWDQKVRHALPT